jgi:DNA invertase Pin-like site-specific DNA recombinase
MAKAMAYCRVSSSGQKWGDGLARQRREVVTFAEQEGYYLGGVYEEAESGTTDFEDRPVFMDMIRHCIDYEVGVIIVEGMDRLAREMRVQEALLIYLVSKNLTLLSARTGENITDAVKSDPMRKALVQIQGVFAELEKGMLVQKLRKARTQVKLTTGRCEGRKPYGYQEGEQDVIDEIMHLRHEKGWTLRQIAMHLNKEEVTTRMGKQWGAKQIQRIIKERRQG